MEIGSVMFIRPKDPLLRKWIKGYYVHFADQEDFHSKVTFYQNITTTISIYRNSVTTSTGRKRRQHYKKDNGFTSLLVGQVDKYQEVEFFGPLDRLAIVFYPAGINHFVRSPLGNFLAPNYSIFNSFDSEFEALLPLVYEIPDLEDKRDILDAFFLSKFELLNEPELLQAVDILCTSYEPVQVEELSDRLGCSRRNLLRKFKKHLGYTIAEYISIIKFRKALFNYQNEKTDIDLTKIALNSNYYDQADFNHNIKSRSGQTPGELFAQLEIVDDVLFWKV